MTSPRLNLSGKRFHRLLVIEQAEDYIAPCGKIQTRWKCVCDCGKEKIVTTISLTSGGSKSCGCRRNELIVKYNTDHGLSYSKAYRTWARIKDRCFNPNSDSYEYYGGRGITVCERWMEFKNFFSDMGHPPTTKHTINRIDNNGNYEPGNCEWSTHSDQMRNTRVNRIFSRNGETKCAAEWAEIFGMDYHFLMGRIKKGWDFKDALTRPKRKMARA